MKRYILVFCCMFAFMANCLAADDWRVRIDPSYSVPGSKHTTFTTPLLPVGVTNMRYAFTVEADDDENSLIDCVIRFPKDLDIKLMSFDGIQALNSEDYDNVTAFTFYEEGNYKCFEFLISQKKDGNGFVELQANLNRKFKGKNIPVSFTFRHYHQSFYQRWKKALFMIPVIGEVVFAYEWYDTGEFPSFGDIHFVNKETIQEIKKKYEPKPMNDSYKVYTLQVE